MLNTTSCSKTDSLSRPENVYSVRINIPFLDTVFYDVPDELIGAFLDATFSILISRYSTWGNCDDVEQFIEITDRYEENIAGCLISTALQFEIDFKYVPPNSQLLRDKEEFYYFTIENILEHYREYFIESPLQNNDDQIEFLISIFEEKRKIQTRYFSYDVVTSNLYLFISS